jgi:hypothetical protein
MAEKGRELVWTSRPAARYPARAVAVALLIGLLGTLVGVWMDSAYWGIFASLVLFLSLESFFLATTYRLGEEGIEVRKPFSRAFRRWDTFRSVYVDRKGITLSPYSGRSVLEPYRAVRLLFADNREAVWDFVRSHLREGVSIREAG